MSRNFTIDHNRRIGLGGSAIVFLGTYNGEEVAVKNLGPSRAFDLCDESLLSQLDHPNVLKLLHWEDVDDFRYHILELCAASLYDFIKGKYGEPIPGDLDALIQMAAGVQHIHSKNLVHQNIKPENILISKPGESERVHLKIGGFSCCEPTEQDGTYELTSVRGTFSYMAPELREIPEEEFITSFNNRFSNAVDVFSLGCVFYLFLTRGEHPFGRGIKIPSNILWGRFDLGALPGDHVAYDLIRRMIQSDPTERPKMDEICEHFAKVKNADFTSASTGEKLGQGGEGLVYRHFYDMKVVAVKRIVENNVKKDERSQREQEIMLKLNHPNVLKLLHWHDTDDFRYLVLELCAYTLHDFIEERAKDQSIQPNEADWLHQMARGLEHIHSKDLAHRDIKPLNILLTRKWHPSERILLKISDFGFCKPTSKQGSYSLASGLKGTVDYMAPELLDLIDKCKDEMVKERATNASDVYSLGCVFFKFLRGTHPFGTKMNDILPNAIKGDPINLEKLKDHFAYSWISEAIASDPNKRPVISKFASQLQEIVDEDITVFPKEDELSRGDNSVIYQKVFGGKLVAVKRVASTDSGNEQTILEQLKHSHIIQLVNYVEKENFRYIVFELCVGNLEHFMAGKHPDVILQETDALGQMALGVEYIHSNSYVHGNIEPSNVLIAKVGGSKIVLKICDFGCCRKVDETLSPSALKPSKNYAAPELLQLLEKKEDEVHEDFHAKFSSDVFSLGVVYFWLMTKGVHPFGGAVNQVDSKDRETDDIELSHLKRKERQDDQVAFEKRVTDGGEVSNLPIEPCASSSSVECPEPKNAPTSSRDSLRSFEGQFNIVSNIIKQNCVNLNRGKGHPAFKLIKQMMQHSPEQRPSLVNIITELRHLNFALSRGRMELHCQIKELNGVQQCLFHPQKPKLACLWNGEICVSSATSHFTPFSEWDKPINNVKDVQSSEPVVRFDWNVDGSMLAAGFEDGTLIVWTEDGKEIFNQKVHKKSFKSLRWNQMKDAAHLLVTGGEDRVATVWTISSDASLSKLERSVTLRKSITKVDWISDQVFVVQNVKVCIYHIGGSLLHAIDDVETFKCCMAKKLLIACDDNDSIQMWDSETKQSTSGKPAIPQTNEDNKGIRCLDWYQRSSQGGSTSWLICGRGFSLLVWELPRDENTANPMELKEHRDDVEAVHFSPDGKFVCSYDAGGCLIIWKTEKWTKVYGQQIGKMKSLSWNSNGGKLAIAEASKVLVLDFDNY